MSSSGLRGLFEDGTTTEQYEHNSEARQYCIVGFRDGDLRMELYQSWFYIAVRQFCWVLTSRGSRPPLFVSRTIPSIYLFLRCPFLPYPEKIQLGLHNLLRYQQMFASNSQYYSVPAFRHVSSQQTHLFNCKI